MNPDFTSLLRCPNTLEPLELRPHEVRGNRVKTGELVSLSGVVYPIVGGIPRFVESNQYAASFAFEWSRWSRTQFEDQNADGPMRGHTTRMWEQCTGQGDADLEGTMIVDFGCGSGRFMDVARRKGARVVGLELSGAVEAAAANLGDDPDVLVVQGDVLRPPFALGAFDGGYSIGVLHHTPAPAAGLRSLASVVSPGGWVACCVYPRGEFYDYRSVARWRRLQHVLEPRFGYRPALAYASAASVLAPLLGRARRFRLGRATSWLEREWFPMLHLPDKRWRTLDMFDAITPEIATTHTDEELAEWFVEAGCHDVQANPWCVTSMVGRASGRP